MLKPDAYLEILQSVGLNFFAGVPDSLLKPICACITDRLGSKNHVITANEGAAIGLAIGHYLATKKVPLVYMQNSGLGNVVNPLLSLASPEVYGIPMVMMIGWRGRPGIKDEPQHVHQGRVTESMLDSMDVPYFVLSDDIGTARQETLAAVTKAVKCNGPVAILIKKGTFDAYPMTAPDNTLSLEREDAIICIADTVENRAVIVCTTGMPSRELFEHRARTGARHETDFLCVGGMGHANHIALGIAMNQTERPVYCIDGDGAALMHMGSMAIIGNSGIHNLTHIVVNNGAHESVGGQPTVGFDIDMPAIATACGYASAVRVIDANEIATQIQKAKSVNGPCFIEVQVRTGHRADIGRPTTTPAQNKTALMAFLNQ